MESQYQDNGPRLLLFGPQAPSFNNESIEKLRSVLHDRPICSWTIETVKDLPTYWNAAITKIPQLQCLSGEELLCDLTTWLTKGIDKNQSNVELPNILLTPLVVLTQLTQYSHYLELCYDKPGSHHAVDFQAMLSGQDIRTLGFCTGMLAAFAISSSRTRVEFEKYGAVAIRLAMLLGAVVDAHELLDTVHGRAKSFSTIWRDTDQRDAMAHVMDQFPEAYTSVLYDEKRATITTSERTAPVLLYRLRTAGITVAEVGVRGRFHCAKHQDTVEALIDHCNAEPTLQFGDATRLALLNCNNTSGEVNGGGSLHEHALRSILVEPSNWHETFATTQAAYIDKATGGSIISFGTERCVPPTLISKLGPRIVHYASLELEMHQRAGSAQDSASHTDPRARHTRTSLDGDIAIVGMSIKVAGADDLNEFSEILRAGKSQHEEVPTARMEFDTLWRGKDERKWYGNFIRDIDAFDHKFFQKSPRESASMDPQQRLFLQAAYQAVEQSGYFTQEHADKHIGCYIGACAGDYEHNAACHPANAFTTTGNLKSFIPGKVSHYFGWTGPSMTFDTACSSSAVAIHAAVRAMAAGECSAALCGGVATMGNPLWFQNLAGACFLSPTGQCKPFDEQADGYCRAEGIACVFLKPMSVALADGNQIFGCISSTAVYQNQNSTPLFVPNAPSLSQLFSDVVKQAQLKPRDISYVEAHGTGTPVGDPAEYQSIRKALGGPIRRSVLSIGSAKGLIGHTEGASGVVSLIKVILMMHEGYIPPQASHSKMNHSIDASPTDMMEVSTSLQPWNEEYKAVLINNYGASGSNASMVVTRDLRKSQATFPIHHSQKNLFWIAGFDDRSITEYCNNLTRFVEKSTTTRLADISFNVCRQSNPSFKNGLIFSCSSVPDLLETLSSSASLSTKIKPPRPVILCFGGQVSSSVALDRDTYESVQILRSYLDQCDAVIRSLGLDGIYPGIFEADQIRDIVKLQTMLFALQYSCAKCWMDCGVKVEAVVGHSFGEITALCVSGVLSLLDAIKLVAGRARIVKDLWGPDSGSMMAVEGDLELVEQLLAETYNTDNGEGRASIACFNGPRNFTLSGPTRAIELVSDTISTHGSFASIKFKKLTVTHAFHSSLVEPLIPSLEDIGRELTFHDPILRLERATKARQPLYNFTPQFVSDHMRNPVFFNHAVQRLAKDYPSSIWLEAGSASTITNMARRALGSTSSDSYFQAVNITNGKGMESLSDATLSLWKEGLRTSFWAHHGLQTAEYAPLLLPPYQFEKARHWLEFKKPPNATLSPTKESVREKEEGLWSFVGYQDTESRRPRFRINTEGEKYHSFTSGHLIAQTASICPATLEVDMAIEALFSIRPDYSAQGLQPVVLMMQNHAPICADATRAVWLEYEALDAEYRMWTWKIFSTDANGRGTEILCVEAKLQFRSPDEQAYRSEFARFERLVNHQMCLKIIKDDDADDIIQGRNVYRTFAEIVDYGEMYRGVRKVVGKGDECGGIVQTTFSSKTWLDVPLSDSFSQISGIWVNCMTERAPKDMFIANGCELSMRSPKVRSNYQRPETWHVLARHHRQSDKEYLTDVFVFDPSNGLLTEVMMGIQYTKVPKASMSKILARLSGNRGTQSVAPVLSTKITTPFESHVQTLSHNEASLNCPTAVSKDESNTKIEPRPDISQSLRSVLANLSGIEASEIHDSSELPDLGIDSLMNMELAREVETVFGCSLDQAALFEATTFRMLVACLASALHGSDYIETSDSSSENCDDVFSEGSSDGRIVTATPSTTSFDTEQSKTDSFLEIPYKDVLDSFREVKMLTDEYIRSHKLDTIDAVDIAHSNRLCAALIVEAFEQLGCPLRKATTGQRLEKITNRQDNSQLIAFLYRFLEEDARLIDINGSQITRTNIPAPRKTSQALLQELLQICPEFAVANRLTYYAGRNLADVLSGKTSGMRLLLGSIEGRELVQALYCDHAFNKMNYAQMKDVIRGLVNKLPRNKGPLRILEMGAGTGGTTRILAPFLASLGVPLEYTFTDISASMVAQARRTFKEHTFMKFVVHDIEKPPVEELRGQHVVIASNAVHATHDLTASCTNIHSALRPDGFLMLLEMTEVVPFVDLIFGLLEGWWLFDDGRQHAIVPADHWETVLHKSGFGHVDWTDGHLPENSFQKVFIALASGLTHKQLPAPDIILPQSDSTRGDVKRREEEAERYVTKHTAGFTAPSFMDRGDHTGQSRGGCVIITGATGSLGSYLVSQFAEREDIHTVVCINRRRSVPVDTRQKQAFSSRGIALPPSSELKLRVLEADTSKLKLGLSASEYAWVVQYGTHIVHNAWPMSGTRSIHAFESQFQTLRNMIDLAHDIACTRGAGFKTSFQLISSIGVVGQYPLWSGQKRVPEERVRMESVLPIGYCEAKWACERMLDETLCRYPEHFRSMVVRLGQIAGSRDSGYWNPVEHFPFMIKSAQSLKLFPNLEGALRWVPVNDVAVVLAELAMADGPVNPVYHIDNPMGQSWSDMTELLAKELDIRCENIIPFKQWVQKVRRSPLCGDPDNPANRLDEFLNDHFVRMSCGGLILDTTKAREHSTALARQGPVATDTARKYVQAWKAMGFLRA